MNRSIEITGNGQSGFLHLGQGRSKIRVLFVGGATGTLTPRESPNEIDVIDVALPTGLTTITKSEVFTVFGPGYFSFGATGVSGTIKVTSEKVD